jgi:hypothetical protein
VAASAGALVALVALTTKYCPSRWNLLWRPVLRLGGYPALVIAGAVVAIIDAVPVTRIKGVT